MKDAKLVWSDEEGDLRKKNPSSKSEDVNEATLQLTLRRLTSGKGRTVIEVSGLPNNKKWCQKLAKNLKKKLGVGGAFKNNSIEIHGEKLSEVCAFLEENALLFKKIGG